MDPAAMNALLDAGCGTTRAAHCPSSHELALFFGDPRDLGTELDSTGGYARVTVSASDWAAASGGEKSTAWMQFPAATAEWSATATHWALIASGEVLWDSGPLTDPLEVTGPGDGPLVRATVRFADSIDPEED